MNHIELFALVAGAVAISALCRRWGWPTPLVLVAAGLVASFAPGLPRLQVNPDVILEFVLPPLLYSAALSSSYQDLRRARNSILRLGIGLVLVTAVAVAVVAWALVPRLPITAALVLGAVVAPPDAVAAVAVGRRLGLPRRVMTLLTGESLINDATSLTLYKVAVAGVATGATALSDGLRVFMVALLVGTGVGLLVAWVVHRVRLRLDDAVVASVVGLLTPFAAYWAAESLGGSGVLAVVAAGLYLGHTAPQAGYATRLYETPIWATVELPLEAFTFALIGVQLKWVIADVIASDQGLRRATVVATAVLATALVIRPLYVFATARVDQVHLRGSHRTPHDALSPREHVVVSWAGMRGVVTLAAAAAIPVTVNGTAFPERATLQLVAYAVAIGTLLLQGLSLPWVITRLGVQEHDDAERDASQEAALRLATAEAAQRVIESKTAGWSRELGPERAQAVTEALVRSGNARAQAAAAMLDPARGDDDPALAGGPHVTVRGKRGHRLRREILDAQRRVLVARRDAGELDEEVMRRVLRELDLEDERMSASWLNRV
jgi:CPA1 family monovalent cation:H+ antiporter